MRWLDVCRVAMIFAVASAAAPAFAASDATEAFRANVRLKASFLAKASALAKTNAGSDKIRAFARSEQDQQVGVIDALTASEPGKAQTATADTGSRDVLTGRSAVAGTAGGGTFAPPGGTGVMMPAAALGLERLAASKGAAFDTLYTSLVHNLLNDLSGYYEAYAMTGDDPALKAIAAREYLKVEAGKAALD